MDLLDDILSSMDKNKRPALSQPDKQIQSKLKHVFGGFCDIPNAVTIIFRELSAATRTSDERTPGDQ